MGSKLKISCPPWTQIIRSHSLYLSSSSQETLLLMSMDFMSDEREEGAYQLEAGRDRAT